ncbi:MAG: phosphomannomutase [Acidobacteria bacterium]|nr:MAG: phosphomannomutase [Acidobacteriota bacterium]
MTIDELMERSGVRFGTSGARGPVDAMTDAVCWAYTAAFIDHLASEGRLGPDRRVLVAGDLRPSTPRILAAVCRAITDRGLVPVDCGRIPTPALVLAGITGRVPSVMVTGSHIPEDRNGIKFHAPDGEILKRDEQAIRARHVELPPIFDRDGMLREPPPARETSAAALEDYRRRYLGGLPPDALAGLRVGVYQHSAVARDLLVEVLEALGAQVVAFGRSETFVPVDTEAVRPEDLALARRRCAEDRLDAVVSTDGDSDRPLVFDEHGEQVRGDVAGILVARALGARIAVTPISSTTAAERCGAFDEVRRTRIGSPYVIAEMLAAAGTGAGPVVGWEANGGFLTASPVRLGDASLAPLPTRDALIVILVLLLECRRRGEPLSALVDALPPRFTASNRLRDVPREIAVARLEALLAGGPRAIERELPFVGTVRSIDTTDGLRLVLDGDEIVHLRPSGNAPELRAYAEADSRERAVELVRLALDAAARWTRPEDPGDAD